MRARRMDIEAVTISPGTHVAGGQSVNVFLKRMTNSRMCWSLPAVPTLEME